MDSNRQTVVILDDVVECQSQVVAF